jgi:hypothetical protein
MIPKNQVVWLIEMLLTIISCLVKINNIYYNQLENKMEIVLKWNIYFTKNQYSSSILASFDFLINYNHTIL